MEILGGDTTWNIKDGNAGDVGGVTFTGIENIFGAADNQDTFIFKEDGSLSGTIDGGVGGTKTLDYSAYTSPVTVNLGPGAATGTSGISNIRNVIGGAGVVTHLGLKGVIPAT